MQGTWNDMYVPDCTTITEVVSTMIPVPRYRVLYRHHSITVYRINPLGMRTSVSYAYNRWCSFFSSEATLGTRWFYTFLAAIVFVYSIVSFLAPWITPECNIPLDGRMLGQGNTGGIEAEPNPSYRRDPCRWTRYAVLLGLNKWEAEMSVRIIMSIVMGSIIGFERCECPPFFSRLRLAISLSCARY